MNNPVHAKDQPYSRKEVVEIIQSVLATMPQSDEVSKKLHADLVALSTYIQSMRAELAQLRSIEISHNHIPTATDELDAVVVETAKATGVIMDCCEQIEKIAEDLGNESGAKLTDSTTKIYEACGFQDITGQRITKVVKTLKNIENKVSEILSAFGQMGQPTPAAQKGPEVPVSGPQLKGPAISQAEIDRLLSSFDK